MSMSPGALIDILLKGQLVPAGDESGGAVCEFSLSERLASGTGLRQADNPHIDVRTLAASASETIDLQGLTNANGATPTVAEVVAILLYADPANVGNLRIDDSPASNWSSLFTSSGGTDDAQLTLPPGAFILAGCVQAAAYAVDAGNRQFLVENLDGSNAGSYTIFLFTRAA